MNIFLSRPNWIEARYEPGLTAFLARLTDAGLTPRTLGKSDYPLAAPLDEVLDIMAECRGAIILGYPQVQVTSGTIKGSPLTGPLSLGTEWNHIEAALAYARHMPLLIVHDVGVARGVFERGVLNGFIYPADLSQPLWSHAVALSGALDTWKSRLAKYAPPIAVAPAAMAAPKGSRPCPNCSTPDRPFFMTQIPADYRSSSGFTHLCNRCNGTFDYSS